MRGVRPTHTLCKTNFPSNSHERFGAMFQVRITKTKLYGASTQYWLKGLDGAACVFTNETHAINAINAAIEFYDIVGTDELQFQIIDMTTQKPHGLPFE